MTVVKEKFIGSDKTVISFSGIGSNDDDTVNEEFYNIHQHGYNVIFVIDEQRSWFNQIDVQKIIDKIKTKKVYAIGNSMGAFNACMFSTLYPVEAVIGFSIQYSIHPDIVPWEKRWQSWTSKIKEWNYKHLEFSENTDYLFINGDQVNDDKHLNLIPHKKNITKIMREGDDHLFPYGLKQERKLYPIINDFLNSKKINSYAYKSKEKQVNKPKRDDVVKLVKQGGVGIELGVAEGEFSERVLQHNRLEHLYSIDMWAGDRGHDVEQYKRVVNRLRPYRANNTILKMRFDEALDLFEDGSLDFIYVDGYAHTAQENGKTLEDWYRKLKPFGIFAGDDYHEHFRENVTVIDLFKDRHSLLLNVINSHEPNSIWSEYPTWWTMKIPPVDMENKTVAIVGNSKSQFEKDQGEEIDNHDVVIRLNRSTALFNPGEYTKSHGEKVDVWCTWRVDEYETFNINRPDHTVQMAFWTGSQYKRMLCYTLAEFNSLMSMYKGPLPSTGLMTLDWVSRKKPASVDVYGFDWKATPTWTDPTRSRDTVHDFDRERKFCEAYFKNALGFKFH